MADNSSENQPPTVEEITTGGEGTTPATVAGGSGRIEGSTYTPVYGRRKEKIYSVNEDELGHLFWVGLSTTLCFSIASFLLAVAFNIHLSLSVSHALPENKTVYWTTLRDGAWYLSLLFLVVGIILIFFGRNRINKIKSKTEFE
jgi:hypothetical protein